MFGDVSLRNWSADGETVAAIEVIAPRTVLTRRRDPALFIDTAQVVLDECVELTLLTDAHRIEGGDDDLRLLGLDQMMQLEAGFLLAGAGSIQQRVTGQLGPVLVRGLIGVRCARRGLVVDNAAAGADQVDDAEQRRCTGQIKIAFNANFDTFGLFPSDRPKAYRSRLRAMTTPELLP